MLAVIAIAVGVSRTASIGSGADAPTSTPWMVVVYAAGGQDDLTTEFLTSELTKDLLPSVRGQANPKIVVLLDSFRDHANLYDVKNGELIAVPKGDCPVELSPGTNLSTGDPKTLETLLKWTVQSRLEKDQQMALVLCGHGAPSRGICWDSWLDSDQGEHDHLSLIETRKALKAGLGNRRVKILALYACNMASIDWAIGVSDCVDHMIACQRVIDTEDGWDCSTIADLPQAPDVAAFFQGTFAKQYLREPNDSLPYPKTVSLTSTHSDAFRRMASGFKDLGFALLRAVKGRPKATHTAFFEAIDNACRFDPEPGTDGGGGHYVDLGDLARCLQASLRKIPNPSADHKASIQLCDFLHSHLSSVVESRDGGERAGVSGLSVFVPNGLRAGDAEVDLRFYRDGCGQSAWLSLLEELQKIDPAVVYVARYIPQWVEGGELTITTAGPNVRAWATLSPKDAPIVSNVPLSAGHPVDWKAFRWPAIQIGDESLHVILTKDEDACKKGGEPPSGRGWSPVTVVRGERQWDATIEWALVPDALGASPRREILVSVTSSIPAKGSQRPAFDLRLEDGDLIVPRRTSGLDGNGHWKLIPWNEQYRGILFTNGASVGLTTVAADAPSHIQLVVAGPKLPNVVWNGQSLFPKTIQND